MLLVSTCQMIWSQMQNLALLASLSLENEKAASTSYPPPENYFHVPCAWTTPSYKNVMKNNKCNRSNLPAGWASNACYYCSGLNPMEKPMHSTKENLPSPTLPSLYIWIKLFWLWLMSHICNDLWSKSIIFQTRLTRWQCSIQSVSDSGF